MNDTGDNCGSCSDFFGRRMCINLCCALWRPNALLRPISLIINHADLKKAKKKRSDVKTMASFHSSVFWFQNLHNHDLDRNGGASKFIRNLKSFIVQLAISLPLSFNQDCRNNSGIAHPVTHFVWPITMWHTLHSVNYAITKKKQYSSSSAIFPNAYTFLIINSQFKIIFASLKTAFHAIQR